MRSLILCLLLTGCASTPTWYVDDEHDIPSCNSSRPPCALGSTGQPDRFWAMRSSTRNLGFMR